MVGYLTEIETVEAINKKTISAEGLREGGGGQSKESG